MEARRLRDGDRTEGGQVLVIFALSLVLFIGMCAVVMDVAWYWTGMLRMQRAADAAALAGVVYLPGNPTSAVSAARAEAARNGFVHGAAGVSVGVTQDAVNNRALRVTVGGGVPTYFMRVFGISSLAGSRLAKAEYVLPVPMGSPDSYYGVFGKVRTPDGGTNVVTTTSGVTELLLPTTTPSGSWATPANARSATDGDAAATKNAVASPHQAWSGFGIAAPGSGTLTVNGIEVQARASAGAPGCVVDAALTWSGAAVTGANWTAAQPLTLTGGPAWTAYAAGGPTWTWGRTWTESQLSNASFRVRLRYTGTGCATGTAVAVDALWVRVSWTRAVTTWVPDPALAGPGGETLNARGFWGAMLSQGAADINGDAYLASYETIGTSSNAEYQPTRFYDYGVYLPPGSASGQLHVFDPVFCGTDGSGQFGTGDRWFSSGTSAVSAFYTLYDTQETLYDLSDDTLVADSGSLFRRIQALDASLYDGGLPSGTSTSCRAGDISDPTDGRYWHNRWWQMVGNLTGGTSGRTYRLRTASTDPANSTDQRTANAQNSFALWSTASGGAPRIYGLGAMESFSPLPGGGSSTFYLARIEAVHAGKTVVIGLWDPGDTGSLSANVQILIPGASEYTAGSLKWTSAKGTTASGASACNGQSGTGTSITANTGTQQKFNGCWVTIEVPIPASYTAATPPGETEGGWWKIRYNIGGSGGDTSFDVTTWQVSIRGNPVHLVLP
jgi:hypothetical protein